MKGWRGHPVVACVVVSLATSAGAQALDDLRLVPSETWLEPARTHVRASESRPWGDLPVQWRRIDAGASVPKLGRVELGVDAGTAGTVRASGFACEVGRSLGVLTFGLGAQLSQLRVGDRVPRSRWDPRVRVRLGAGASTLVVRWDGDAPSRPADSVSIAAQGTLGGAVVALERAPDRYGSGAVWHAAIGADLGTALRIAVAWSADDLRALAELRAARWRLRVATVLEGPRAGARAVEVGWVR